MGKQNKEKKTEKVELTDEQKIERDQRTIFVGNLPVDASLKKVKKFFKTEVGRVEHIRFRSICTVQDSKKSERAKIITKEFNTDQKDNKNAYICFEKEDSTETLSAMVNKIVNLRVFEDEQNRMNFNVSQAQGKILSISQFTLSWDGTKGHRPSFDKSIAARSDLPISRWISCVLPDCLPRAASRPIREPVERGNIPYSAVIQP